MAPTIGDHLQQPARRQLWPRDGYAGVLCCVALRWLGLACFFAWQEGGPVIIIIFVPRNTVLCSNACFKLTEARDKEPS